MEETKDKTLNYTGEEHLDFHDVPYEGGQKDNGNGEDDYNFDFLENDEDLEKRAEYVNANIWENLRNQVPKSRLFDIIALTTI
ncbi:MAG: hypothetical protein IPG53_11455 [Ignavibacteriales bacterium]|nr:hypothetical protein [Ignavibacteriales bacterium]